LRILTPLLILVATVAVPFPTSAAPSEPVECAAGATAADLDAFFSADAAAGLAGEDFPRAAALPDGRRLWWFQDALIGTGSDLWSATFAHNGALVQSENCFELLSRSGGPGTAWIGSWVEDQGNQWLWPLDAEIGADGNLWLFLASMRNPNGKGASQGAEPTGTWRARLRLPDLSLVDLEPATDRSTALFGYSIVSDLDWTYLYANCQRLFSTAGLDPDCSPYTYVARVPKGRLDDPLVYWDGAGWSSSPSDRQPVLEGEGSFAASVERFESVYVAVADEGEWFGHDVVVSTASAAEGPWTEVVRYTPPTRCDGCHNYGAFVMPYLEDGKVVVAHSNNAWDWLGRAMPDASVYRINVSTVAVPGVPGPPLPEPAPSTTAPPEAVALAGAVEDGAAAADDPGIAAPVDVGGPSVSVHATRRFAASDGSAVWSTLTVLALAAASLLLVAGVAGMARTVRSTDPARRRRALLRLRARRSTGPHDRPPRRVSGQLRSPHDPRRPRRPDVLDVHPASLSTALADGRHHAGSSGSRRHVPPTQRSPADRRAEAGTDRPEPDVARSRT
jgi:hypothetical protein